MDSVRSIGGYFGSYVYPNVADGKGGAQGFGNQRLALRQILISARATSCHRIFLRRYRCLRFKGRNPIVEHCVEPDGAFRIWRCGA